MREEIASAGPECPRCRRGLGPQTAEGHWLHRCQACRGIWLDPVTFRAVCETDARQGGGGAGQGGPPPQAGVRDEPVRYLRCPVCRDVMGRVNFARVSGVVIDVCRPHGAWFDAGELRAIRRFLRGAGLEKAAGRRALAAERDRRRQESGGPVLAPSPDLLDVFTGDTGPWDIPSTGPAWRDFAWAAALGSAGAFLLWSAFRATGPGRPVGGAVLGTLLIISAIRCAARGLGRRS